MITYIKPTEERKSTKRKLELFTQWAENSPQAFEGVFNALDELITQIHEENDSRPFWVNLETLLCGFQDCLEHKRSTEEGNNVL